MEILVLLCVDHDYQIGKFSKLVGHMMNKFTFGQLWSKVDQTVTEFDHVWGSFF